MTGSRLVAAFLAWLGRPSGPVGTCRLAATARHARSAPHAPALTDVGAGVVCTASSLTVRLTAPVPVEHGGRDVTTEFKLAEGQSAVFAIDEVGSDPRCDLPADDGPRLVTKAEAFAQYEGAVAASPCGGARRCHSRGSRVVIWGVGYPSLKEPVV